MNADTKAVALERCFLRMMLAADKKDIAEYRRQGITLEQDDFTGKARQYIFGALENQLAAGRSQDAVQLVNAANELEAEVLTELSKISTAQSGDPRWMPGYAHDIRDASVMRRMEHAVEKLNTQMALPGADPSKIAQDVLTEFTGMAQALSTNPDSLKTGNQAFRDYLKQVWEYQEGKLQRGLNTGLPSLDRQTGGLRRKTVNIIAARPGVGKSALALNIALNVLNASEPEGKGAIVLFTLEMPAEDIVSRAGANVSGTPVKDMEECQVPQQGWDSMMNFFEHQGRRFFIDDRGTLRPSDVDAVLSRIESEYGTPMLVVIDYIQLMTSDLKAENQTVRVAQISRALKQLSGRYNCPFVVLSQMNRASLKNDDGPQNSDLRDSGALEQDADTIMFLEAKKSETDLWLSLTKNRRGGLRVGENKIRLRFDKPTQRILETGGEAYE